VHNPDGFHGVRSNFVVDAIGNFKDSSGSSRNISNDPDFQMLLKLRSQADLIITDAATAAKEHYRPSKYAAIEIWSKTGNFRGMNEQEGFALVTTTDASEMLRQRKMVFDSILLEAGPTLTRTLAVSELIDELRLSVVGARNSEEAENVARGFSNSVGLSYLHNKTLATVPETHFFTFSR
jgi:riboflavin biosynthesis pyrimidine reductase